MSTTTIPPSMRVTQKIGCKIYHNMSFNQYRLPNGSIKIKLQDDADRTLLEQGSVTFDSVPLTGKFPEGESFLRHWIHGKELMNPPTMASIIDTNSKGITFTGSQPSHLPDYEWEASIMLVTDPFYLKDPPNPTQSTSLLCIPSTGPSGRITEDSTCNGLSDSAKGNSGCQG
jgi:hypothetical protein